MAARSGVAWRPHYAWIVLGVTFATLLVAGATRATPGVLIVPLEQHFGWSRATISLAISLNLVLFGLMGPFSAALVEYLGARRTMIGALLLVCFVTKLCRDGNRRRTSSNHSSVHKVRS